MGSMFTSSRTPVTMVYAEEHPNWDRAQQRERQIKRWTRAKKEALIAARDLHASNTIVASKTYREALQSISGESESVGVARTIGVICHYASVVSVLGKSGVNERHMHAPPERARRGRL